MTLTIPEPNAPDIAPGTGNCRWTSMIWRGMGVTLMMLAVGLPTARAQDVSVQDEHANTLMQVNDEGTGGSLSLPPVAAPPADSTAKLHHLGGALRWRDAQLGTGWTRTGTNLHLSHSGDRVGIGVADPDARLEVAGQVRITGGAPGANKLLVSDGAGLAAWKTVHQPKAAFVGGNYQFQLAATPRLVKQISIAVPAAGTVHVSATGYASWEGRQKDSARFCLSASSSADMNAGYLTELTDQGCTDHTDQYASWRTQRGFTVGSAGTYTYFLWADAPLTDNINPCIDPTDCSSGPGGVDCCCNDGDDDRSQTTLGDVNMFVRYRPAQ